MNARTRLVTLADVEAAQRIIAGRLHRTPTLRSTYLGRKSNALVWLKMELFQKTGSFKPRGVLNKFHHLPPEEKARGVITISAGNHAQAVAWAAAEERVAATVVMPAGAVPSKIDAAKGYGAEVILTGADLLETCESLRKERKLTMIHPFDDPLVIAGQGTVGAELMADVPDVDVVLVGVGGGGLISGVGAAVKATRPKARVIGVEPEGSAVMLESLRVGRPSQLHGASTIADGLNAPFTGQHTLAHAQAFTDGIITVDDDAIVEAMRILLERCKIAAEPAGAASVAALLSGRVAIDPGDQAVCVVSGGNVDIGRLRVLL